MLLNFLIYLLFSFIFCFTLAPFFIGLLYKFNLRRINKADLDDKLPDRSLKFGTPVMGGALITISVLMSIIFFSRSWDMKVPFIVILVLGSIFGAIDEYVNTIGRKGFSFAVREAVDAVVSRHAFIFFFYKIILVPWDLFKEAFRVMGSTQRGLKTHEKFLLQVLIAGVGSYYIYNILGRSVLWLPLLGEFDLGVFYPVFITVLALGFANAFGVTDGMDGLSAGLHSISFLALGVLSLVFGDYNLAMLCASVVGAELAFLYFNVHPARVEMSDVGTLPLGMLFAFTAVLLKREILLPLLGGIFVIEILSSFIQQWSAKLRNGKRVFLLAPVHHHFEKKGWHETKVTMRFWVIQSIFCVVGLIFALL